MVDVKAVTLHINSNKNTNSNENSNDIGNKNYIISISEVPHL